MSKVIRKKSIKAQTTTRTGRGCEERKLRSKETLKEFRKTRFSLVAQRSQDKRKTNQLKEKKVSKNVEKNRKK